MDSSWREALRNGGSGGGKEDWRDYLPKKTPEEEQVPMQSTHADPVLSVEPSTAPDEFSDYGTTGAEAAQSVVDPNAPPSEEELLAATRERDATDRRREQMLGRGRSEHDYTSSAGFVIRDGVPMWPNPIAQPAAVIEEEDKYPGVSAKELIRRKEHGENIPYSQILNEKKLDELNPVDRVFVQARAAIGAATKYATLVPDYAEEGRKPPEVMSYEWLTDVLPKSFANFVIALPHFFASAGDAGYQLGNILGRYVGDRVEKYQSGASAQELSAIDAQLLDDLEKSYPAEFGKMMVNAITSYGGLKDVFTDEGRKFDYEVMKHAWRSEPALGILLLVGAGLKARRMARGEPGPIGRALDKMVVDRAKRYRDIRNHVRETLRNKFDEVPAGDREFNNWVAGLPEETRTRAIKEALEPLKPIDVTEIGEQGTYMGREYKTLGITEDGYARVVFASGEEGLIPVYYKWRGPTGWWVKKREIPKRFTRKRFIKNQPEMRGVRKTDVTRKDGKPFSTRAATNRTRKLLRERGEGDYEPVQLGKSRWVLREVEKTTEAAPREQKTKAAPKSRVEELTDHFYRDAEEARATLEKRADSPQLFIEQQIAAVNEWLRGEDIDISLVRENVGRMKEGLGELARHLKMKAEERRDVEKQLKLLEEWMEETKDRRREEVKTEAPPEKGKIPDRERRVEEELEPSPKELKALEKELAEEGIIPEKAEELRVEREDLGPSTEAAPEVPPKAPSDFRMTPEEVKAAKREISDARQRYGATTENVTVTEAVDSALLDANKALNTKDPAALIDAQARLLQIVDLVDWTRGVNPKLLRYLRDVNRWAQEQEIPRRAPQELKIAELAEEEAGVKLRSADPFALLAEKAWDRIKKRAKGEFINLSTDEGQLVRRLIEKYGKKNPVIADITYSRGVVWDKIGIEPQIKIDRRVQKSGVVQADITQGLPLRDKSVDVLYYDPPYLISGSNKSAMESRFTGFRNVDELKTLHRAAMKEAARVLRKGGILIVKVQPAVEGHSGIKKYYIDSGAFIYNNARLNGMEMRGAQSYYVNPGGFAGTTKGPAKYHPKQVVSEYVVFENRNKPIPATDLYSADPVGILLERAWKKMDKLREENKLALSLKREQDRKRFLDSLLDDARISKQMLEKAGLAARDAYNKLIISRGFTGESAWVVRIMDDTIYKPLSKRQREALDEFLFLDRIVQLEEGPTRKKKYVHPQGITAEEARVARDHIAARFPDLTNKELETVILKAGQYHELMKGELKVLLDGGMITRDAYEKMLGLRYVRRKNLVDDIDPIHHYKFGDKTIAVHDSGISAAQIGRASDVLSLDSRALAIEVINRARGRKYKNNANQALARFAIDNPDNSFVSKKTRKGWQKVTYYESGKKQSLWLRNDFAHGWVSATGPVSPYILNTLKFISGSNVLKTFATGVNPGFALRNLPRDLAHIWLVSQYMDANGKWVGTYSPNIFKAAAEMGRDLPKTLKEAWTKGDLFQEAAETGMMMEFMVHQARLFHEPSGLKGKMRTVYNVLSKLGEVSEVSTRLMLREQALRKIAKREEITIEEARADKSFAYEASTIARDYLDFGQYGSTTRVLDSMVPYLNAGIQGTRGVFRAARRNPIEFTAKAGQIMATAGLLYMLGSRLAPEIWDSIDQQKKRDNWVIPLPMLGYRKDEHGGKHYYYITIPKDNGQRFFASMAEAAMGNMMGDPETRVPKLEDLAAAFSSTISPVDPSYMPLPPLVNAFAAMSGQDLRRLEELWRGKTVDIDEEYEVQFGSRGGTHPFFQDLGKAGIPPQRLRGILESYFTGNNEVFAALGLGYKAVFHDVDFENADVRNILAKWPTTKGIIKETHPYTMFAKPLEEAQRKQSTQEKRAYREVQEPLDKYLFRDGGPDALAEAYTRAVRAYETGPALGDSLIDFIGISMITSKLPDRSLMMRLRALSPEARADGLWQVMKNLPDERRAELLTQMLQTPGLFTERFLNRFMANQVEEE